MENSGNVSRKEKSVIIVIFITLIIGIAVGFLAAVLFFRSYEVGTLRIDNSDPDSPPYLFLEVEHGKSSVLQRSKYVRMKVDLRGYLPRK